MVRPAHIRISTVTGPTASATGSAIAPSSVHSSMTPAAAGNEQQRENPGKEHPGLLHYLIQPDDAQTQGSQQQHQTIDAGRDGQRQHSMQQLS